MSKLVANKITIVGQKGHVVVGSYKADGNISVTTMRPMFELGNGNSTIPNIMFSLSKVLNRLMANENVGPTIVSVMEIVGNKVNGTALVEEHLSGHQLSNGREFSDPEKVVYAELVKAIQKSYGTVVVKPDTYICKFVKPGLTQEQLEWANLHTACRESLKQKMAPPAPKVVVENNHEFEPMDFGDEEDEEIPF